MSVTLLSLQLCLFRPLLPIFISIEMMWKDTVIVQRTGEQSTSALCIIKKVAPAENETKVKRNTLPHTRTIC